MNKIICVLLLSILAPYLSIGQERSDSSKWFITANVNVYKPLGNPYQKSFAVLWHDANAKPRIQIGGFGLGIAHTGTVRKNSYLRVAANLSKHKYWDEPISLTDINAQSAGILYRWSTDFNFNFFTTIHQKLSSTVSVGAGLGIHTNLVSTGRIPNWDPQKNQFIHNSKSTIARNGYYKLFNPTIPLEISFFRKKATYSMRYEQALLNKLAGSVSDFLEENYGVFYFEGAWRIR